MKTPLDGYFVVYLLYLLGYSFNGQTLLMINFIPAFIFFNLHKGLSYFNCSDCSIITFFFMDEISSHDSLS